MTLLTRLLGHDRDTTAELLARCAELDDAQLDAVVDVGWGSVRDTLEHMLFNIEAWGAMMRDVPRRDRLTGARLADLSAAFDAAYAEFAAFALSIEAAGRLDDLWIDVLDNPPAQKSYGGAILHVILHNMHHRTELLHMLARLGLADLPEGDLMGWEMDQRTA